MYKTQQTNKHFVRITRKRKKKQVVYNYRMGLGLIKEKCVNAVTSMIFPKKKGYQIQHSNWSEYNYSTGTDLKVFDCEGRFLLDCEVKNWQFFVRAYGTAIIESEVFDRFVTSTARLKLLVISYLSLIPKSLLPKFKQLGITIIETSQLTTNQSFYKVFNQLIKPLHTIKQQLQQPFKHKELMTYNNNNNTKNNTKNVDTNIVTVNNSSNKQQIFLENPSKLLNKEGFRNG